jgi:hypothetical protein
MAPKQPVFRRPRCSPREDEAHFLRVGFILGLCLMLALPAIFGAVAPAPPAAVSQGGTP